MTMPIIVENVFSWFRNRGEWQRCGGLIVKGGMWVTTYDAFAAPSKVEGLTASDGGTYSVLAWNEATSVSGIDHYTIYVDGILAQTGIVLLTCMAIGLQMGHTYSMQVSATGGNGIEGPKSDAVEVTMHDTVPPWKVENVVATPAIAEIGLVWDEPYDNVGILKYRIKMGTLLPDYPTVTSDALSPSAPSATWGNASEMATAACFGYNAPDDLTRFRAKQIAQWVQGAATGIHGAPLPVTWTYYNSGAHTGGVQSAHIGSVTVDFDHDVYDDFELHSGPCLAVSCISYTQWQQISETFTAGAMVDAVTLTDTEATLAFTASGLSPVKAYNFTVEAADTSNNWGEASDIASVETPFWNYLFFDDFNREDGPVGADELGNDQEADWLHGSAIPHIVSHQLAAESGVRMWANGAPDSHDCKVSIKLASTNGAVGILLRTYRGGGGYELYVGAPNYFRIYDLWSGTVLIASASYTANVGDEISFDASDNILKGYVNGVELLSVTAPHSGYSNPNVAYRPKTGLIFTVPVGQSKYVDNFTIEGTVYVPPFEVIDYELHDTFAINADIDVTVEA